MKQIDKFSHLFVMGFKTAMANKVTIVARSLFYLGILFVFTNLWKATNLIGSGTDKSGLVWYLAITEWIILSTPLVFLEIERDIRSGQIGQYLNKPISYLNLRLSLHFGEYCGRALLLGAVGFWGAGILTAFQVPKTETVAIIFILGFISGFLYLTMQVLIGFSTIWFKDASPIHWIVQKFAFLFGGLIIPLSFYPPWAENISKWSPFASMLYDVASLSLSEKSVFEIISISLLLLGWTLLFYLISQVIYFLGHRSLSVNGG